MSHQGGSADPVGNQQIGALSERAAIEVYRSSKLMNDLSTRLPRAACRHRTTDREVRTPDLKRRVPGVRSVLGGGFVLETLLVSLALGLMIGLPVISH